MDHRPVVPAADAEVLRFIAAALGRPEDDALVAEVGVDTAEIWQTLYDGIYRHADGSGSSMPEPARLRDAS
jgi:hypothetical protein